MAVNFSRKVFLGNTQNGIDAFHFQVLDFMAFAADKMIVRSNSSVETVCPVSGGDFYNFPHISQQGKVAINSSEADIRKLFTQICVNGVGGGVVNSGGQKFFDGFSLPAVF